MKRVLPINIDHAVLYDDLPCKKDRCVGKTGRNMRPDGSTSTANLHLKK